MALTEEEVLVRHAVLLEAESSNPMGIHWLSFADPEKSPGEQFLGVLVVRARGFVSAVQFSHRMGLNPGGEVQGYEIPSDPEFEAVLGGQ